MLGVERGLFGKPVAARFDVPGRTARFLGLLRRDESLLLHAVQHVVLALAGAFRMAVGRVAAGRLGQTGQNGAFGQIQIFNRFIEVVLGRRLDPVGPVPQVDLVQIKIEYILLAEGLGDPIGQDGLLEFALVAALRGQEKGFGDLLGDGAAALDDLAGFDIFEKCPHNTDKIDAPVFVETRIFRRQEGFHEHVGHGFQGQDDAALFVELGDFLSVIGIDHRNGRRPVVRQARNLGKLPGNVQKEPCSGQTAGHQH